MCTLVIRLRRRQVLALLYGDPLCYPLSLPIIIIDSYLANTLMYPAKYISYREGVVPRGFSAIRSGITRFLARLSTNLLLTILLP
jgi:hypothetical protein